MVNTQKLQKKLNKYFQLTLDQNISFTNALGAILRGEYLNN